MTSRECEIKIALEEEGLVRLHHLLGPAARVILQRNHYLDTPTGHLRRRKHGLRLRLELILLPSVIDPPEHAVQRILASLPPWEAAPGESVRVAWATPGVAPEAAPERYVLSLKGPSTRVGDWVDRMDEQAVISQAQAEDIILGGAGARELPLPHLILLAEELGFDQVRVLGASDNLRRAYELDLGTDLGPGETGDLPPLRLEVDSTRYPGGTIEHEAELELPHRFLCPGAPPGAEAVRAALRRLFDRANVSWTPSARGKFARFLERAGLVD